MAPPTGAKPRKRKQPAYAGHPTRAPYKFKIEVLLGSVNFNSKRVAHAGRPAACWAGRPQCRWEDGNVPTPARLKLLGRGLGGRERREGRMFGGGGGGGGGAGRAFELCISTHRGSALPRWVRSSEAPGCMLCRKTFMKLLCPKHHCRRCGRAVCGDCSPTTMFLDRWLADTKPHALSEGKSPAKLRVCNACLEEDRAQEAVLLEENRDRVRELRTELRDNPDINPETHTQTLTHTPTCAQRLTHTHRNRHMHRHETDTDTLRHIYKRTCAAICTETHAHTYSRTRPFASSVAFVPTENGERPLRA